MKATIIGTGSICGCHVHAMKKRGVAVVAVCDIDGKKAAEFASKHGLDCPVFTDWKEMLLSVPCDCVHICTPHHLHAEMAEFALNHGINVFSEKPLCTTTEQLAVIENAVNNSSARYGVCFQNRYLPSNVEAKNLLSDAEVYSASGSVLWERDEKYYASGDWRGKWATEGGGALINQAIHTLDLMLYFTGAAKSVTADMKNDHLKGIIEVEDKAALLVDMGDFNMTFYATTAAKGSHPVTASFYTDKGVITVLGNELMVDGKKIETKESGAIIGKLDWGAGHELIIADFYDCIENGKPFKCDLQACLPTMKTVLSAYESAKTGKTVKL